MLYPGSGLPRVARLLTSVYFCAGVWAYGFLYWGQSISAVFLSIGLACYLTAVVIAAVQQGNLK